MAVPEVTHGDVHHARGKVLIAVADLPEGGVREVQTEEYGVLAVGIAEGRPFAVSNLCRHQFAKLGRGQVRDGCLECPWHRARYDVVSGAMVDGPKGKLFGFGPYSKTVQAAANAVAPLKTYDVELRNGEIVLR